MRRRDALRLSALGLLAMSDPLAAAPRRPAFATDLDAELAGIVRDPDATLASLAAIVVRGGRVAYEGYFGRRFIDPVDRARDRPVDAGTLFRIASISKLVTTLGVLRLVEAGRLDLDADAGSYLGYPLRNPRFPDAPVTLRMMLCHTSSLRDHAGYFWDQGVDLRDVLLPGGSRYGDGGAWSPQAKPGDYFEYTNLSWGVIGTVMERVTGERFDRLMKRLVLDPLGLHGGFSPADLPRAQLANVATLYRTRSNADDDAPWFPGGPWIPQVDDYSTTEPVPRAGPAYVPGRNGTLFGPQGNLRASAAELARVMRMLMAGGELDGRRFLQRSTVDEMLRTQWRYAGPASGLAAYGPLPQRFNAWGLGNQHFLDVPGGDRFVERGGFTAAGHLGDAWGLIGTFAFNRERGDGFAYLCGGTTFKPHTRPGVYSSYFRFEERIMTALFDRALK
jgi:CubicO group peptidase (beta-lactamase class C family)